MGFLAIFLTHCSFRTALSSASDAKLLKMSLTGPSEPEPPKKRKTRDPSLPALSSQAGTSTVKTEKPVRKRPKQDPASSAAPSKAGSSSAPVKKSSTKDQKDISAAPSKTLVKPHGRKPVKPPFIEVPTKPHQRQLLLLPQFSPKIPMWMCGAGHLLWSWRSICWTASLPTIRRCQPYVFPTGSSAFLHSLSSKF